MLVSFTLREPSIIICLLAQPITLMRLVRLNFRGFFTVIWRPCNCFCSRVHYSANASAICNVRLNFSMNLAHTHLHTGVSWSILRISSHPKLNDTEPSTSFRWVSNIRHVIWWHTLFFIEFLFDMIGIIIQNLIGIYIAIS